MTPNAPVRVGDQGPAWDNGRTTKDGPGGRVREHRPESQSLADTTLGSVD